MQRCAPLDLADQLDEKAILDMHRALLEHTEPTIAGRWRLEQVWVGGTAYGPHTADYIAPHQDRVPAAITDLARFARRNVIPVLVHVAIAHAQFETIHPFSDGTGRTGRALVHLMLRAKSLTRKVTVPVSAGLLADTRTYFDTLTRNRQGEIAPIVETMANASLRAIDNGRRLVDQLRNIRHGWNDTVRARRDSSAWDLADLLPASGGTECGSRARSSTRWTSSPHGRGEGAERVRAPCAQLARTDDLAHRPVDSGPDPADLPQAGAMTRTAHSYRAARWGVGPCRSGATMTAWQHGGVTMPQHLLGRISGPAGPGRH